jgi:hypothetical protein
MHPGALGGLVYAYWIKRRRKPEDLHGCGCVLGMIHISTNINAGRVAGIGDFLSMPNSIRHLFIHGVLGSSTRGLNYSS